MKLWIKKGAWVSQKGRKIIEKLTPEKVERVAVIRHAALGDMILTRNFLVELKKLFVHANITFSVVSNYTSAIPEDLVDDVHILDVGNKHKSNLFDKVKNLKRLGDHDIIFDLAATARSLWLCKLNKAKLKIGFPYRIPYRYLFYDIVVPRSDLNFEVDDMLNMLKIFGHYPQLPRIYNLPGDPLERERPYILYFTSASDKYKCWPEKNFVVLLTLMSEKYKEYDHLVLEGKADWESIDNIIHDLKSFSNVFPANAKSVEAVISIVKGSGLVISNDTSVRNIAITAGIPTVGLFFATPPFRYLPNDGKHKAVFNSDGTVPAVEKAYTAIKEVLL